MNVIYSLCVITGLYFLQGCSLIEDQYTVSSCDDSTVNISNTTRSGELTTSETWSGTITITGDILVGENCTLTIEAGSIINFTANSDSTNNGFTTPITDEFFPYDPATKPSEFSGIELWGGSLIAVGTTDNPITFTSDADNKVEGDWHSIALRKEGSRLNLQYSIVEYGYYGIQFNESTNNKRKLPYISQRMNDFQFEVIRSKKYSDFKQQLDHDD